MKKLNKPLLIIVAVLVAVASLTGGAVASAVNKSITMIIDGQSNRTSVWGSTVQDALDAQRIAIGEHDEVFPAATETIRDGSTVEVRFGRELTVTIDGQEQTFWTTATTLAEALTEIGLHDPETRLSIDRATPLGRAGLSFSATTRSVRPRPEGVPPSLCAACGGRGPGSWDDARQDSLSRGGSHRLHRRHRGRLRPDGASGLAPRALLKCRCIFI